MGNCCKRGQKEEDYVDDDQSTDNLLSPTAQDETDDHTTEKGVGQQQVYGIQREMVGQVTVKLQEFAAAKEAQERHAIAQREASSRQTITTDKGISIRDLLRQGYQLKYHYPGPTLDLSLKISQLVQSCEEYIDILASQDTIKAQSEADALVNELLQFRTHLGSELLPLSMKNAFYRQRILIESGSEVKRQFRLDCIQFFEPILFYGNSAGEPHELVKLYVFFLTETIKTTPFMTFYLERTCHAGEFYHCLCFFCEGNVRGQFHIYGDRCPSYWELRTDVLCNAEKTVQHIVTKGQEPLPETICVTVLQNPREPGPIIL